MNGLSDVRLALRDQELMAEQPRIEGAKCAAPMPGTGRWSQFWQRRRTRQALLTLTSSELKDIGLTRADALNEGLKPFWRS